MADLVTKLMQLGLVIFGDMITEFATKELGFIGFTDFPDGEIAV